MELIDKIKDLISLMNENDLAEIEVDEGATKIRLKKLGTDMIQTSIQVPSIQPPMQEGQTKYLNTPQEGGKLHEIAAPMVGTFYSSTPGADSYVKADDAIDEETVVCIIEAMKIMNEVKAEVKGKIVEVLVENGTAVEYGQPLFSVEKSEE